MTQTVPDVSLEQLLRDHHDEIERIITFVVRRRRLPPSDAHDLAAGIWLKLVEGDYEVLRKWERRSTLRTYLTTVIQRLALDYLVTAWGRWRPSAVAAHMGPTAVTLERLTARDGVPLGEAIRTLRINHGVPESEDDLYAMAARLPVRSRRPVADGGDPDERAAPPIADPIEQRELVAELGRAGQVLRQALDTLPPPDRLLLTMRFEQGMAVSEIARALGQEQKPLYRHLEAILKRLRSVLEAAGIDGRRLTPVIDGEGTAEAGPAGAEIAQGRPSL